MKSVGPVEGKPTRRSLLTGGAVGVGAAWVAPAIITVPAAAQTPSPEGPRFLTSFGEQGSGPGQFNSPMSLAPDPEGLVFVADTGNHRIQVIDLFLDQSGFSGQFGGLGSGDAQFDHPTGVAYGGFGRVLVADQMNHRAKVFTEGGNHLLSIGHDLPATQGEWGYFEVPHGVAFDNDHRILVTEDSDNNRIQFFTSTGDWDGNYGGFGQPGLQRPLGVSVDASNRIYIADSWNARVVVLGPPGTEYIDLGFSPTDVATDSGGNLYVCDRLNHRIVVLDDARNVIHILGEPGSGDGQFNLPWGVAVDSAQRVYVADSGNHRIQVFTPL